MNLNYWKNFESINAISIKRSFTIINANDRFCSKSEKLNNFFKNELDKLGIKVLYNTKLVNVNKDQNLTIENKDGKQKLFFNYLYTNIPSKKNQLFDQKLSSDGYKVNVNEYL